MRILMLSQFFPPIIGGEERHVLTLSEGLAARGHDVSVVTLPHPQRPKRLERNGVTALSVEGFTQRSRALYSESVRRHAPPFPDPEFAFKLHRLIRALKPDVIHGHNWLSRSFLPLRRFVDAPFVVTLHDYSLTCAIKNMLYKGAPCSGPAPAKCLSCSARHYGPLVGGATCAGNWISGRIERGTVDKYIAVSRAVARQCGLEQGRAPYEVLPTFIADDVGTVSDIPDERLALLPPDGYLLFVGDLTRGKGVDVLLDAYRRLHDAPPLVLIGRRCQDTPSELPPNVSLFESWPHPAVMQAWRRCLFGMAPSVWAEACGTIVMEANAVGKTMIASGIGGLSDLIDDGKTGLLVAPGDPVALGEAMQRLIGDPAFREVMAKASLSHVERFMSKSVVPRIERVYREVCSGRAPQHDRASQAALVSGSAP